MKPNLKKWLVVIPARLESSRLPGKPLQLVNQKPLVQWVYQRVSTLAGYGAKVLVAIDDVATEVACKGLDIPYLMTAKTHASGTDRVAEVASQELDRPYVLNVQGDEPDIGVVDLVNLMQRLEDSNGSMGTLVYRMDDKEVLQNPNRVKAIVSSEGIATDFVRDFSTVEKKVDKSADKSLASGVFLHIGVYAFARSYLLEFCDLPQSEREKALRLEQLRAVDSGTKILAVEAAAFTSGIDTPEDLERFRLEQNQSSD